MEPTSFTVKEEDARGREEFVQTKLLTRLTYGLSGMEGHVKIGEDGNVRFHEEEGMDYAATTVRLPGGEYVPFLFTIKDFDGQGTLDSFSGDFTVPSYRGSTFMDPKVCCARVHSSGCLMDAYAGTCTSSALPYCQSQFSSPWVHGCANQFWNQ